MGGAPKGKIVPLSHLCSPKQECVASMPTGFPYIPIHPRALTGVNPHFPTRTGTFSQ